MAVRAPGTAPGREVDVLPAVAADEAEVEGVAARGEPSAPGEGQVVARHREGHGAYVVAAVEVEVGPDVGAHGVDPRARRAHLVQRRPEEAREGRGEGDTIAHVAEVVVEAVARVEEEARAPVDEGAHTPRGEHAEGQEHLAVELTQVEGAIGAALGDHSAGEIGVGRRAPTQVVEGVDAAVEAHAVAHLGVGIEAQAGVEVGLGAPCRVAVGHGPERNARRPGPDAQSPVVREVAAGAEKPFDTNAGVAGAARVAQRVGDGGDAGRVAEGFALDGCHLVARGPERGRLGARRGGNEREGEGEGAALHGASAGAGAAVV